MPAAKDCHVLSAYYKKKFKEYYGHEANINTHAARWGFDSVLMDMNGKDAKALLDYYFTTPPTKKHDLDWFLKNYHKLIAARAASEADKEHRAKLMEESKIRAERWRQSGKQGIADNQRGSTE